MQKQPLWSLTALTIPSREEYLGRLIASAEATGIGKDAEFVVVYNQPCKGDRREVEERIRALGSAIPVSVYFNEREPTIASGRNLQLTLCKFPLICFLDDDLTIHGEVFPRLERTLREKGVALVGIPSYVEDTEELFKPRETTPSVDHDGIRYMPVQGMMIATFRDLILDAGGFNPRREFWGEWTELNLRLWRRGFPSGYDMEAGFLRHWHKAPESPTRNLSGKEKHVLWGLICTALEYDAVDEDRASQTFWNLVEDRYLAYSFGENLSPKNLLKTMLALMPNISAAWAGIAQMRAETAKDPFQFKPFQEVTLSDVKKVIHHSNAAMKKIRNAVPGWERRGVIGVLKARLGKLFGARK